MLECLLTPWDSVDQGDLDLDRVLIQPEVVLVEAAEVVAGVTNFNLQVHLVFEISNQTKKGIVEDLLQIMT